VTTNDPVKGSFFLQMSLVINTANETPKGLQMGPFIVGPSNTWSGRLPQGLSGSGIISITTNNSGKPVRLTKLNPGEGNAFKASLETLEEGKRYTLSFNSSNDLEIGNYRQVVKLATDDPQYPELSINLEMIIISPVLLNPTTLNFENVPVSSPDLNLQSLSRFVWVRQAKGMGIEVKSASSDLPFIKVKIESRDGATVLYRVSFIEKPPKGIHNGKLTFEVTSPVNKVFEIPVTVNAQ
jgi:hypothetical protein